MVGILIYFHSLPSDGPDSWNGSQPLEIIIKQKNQLSLAGGVDRQVRTECFTGWPSKQDHFSSQILESMRHESKDGEAVVCPGLSPLGSDGVWIASAALVGTSSCPFPKGVVARCFNPPERLAGW